MNDKIPIIIYAYEPDDGLLDLLGELEKSDQKNIIVVNDGSGEEYSSLFARAKELLQPHGTVICCHGHKGKGGALKTAFSYVLKNMPDAAGVVTVGSECLPVTESILSVEKKLLENPCSLVLGVRNFNEQGISRKSKFGNKLTSKVLQYVSGISLSDPRSGLRGIPASFLPECIAIRDNGFEFGMEMLLRTSGRTGIVEVQTGTFSCSDKKRHTHARTFLDSVKIYRVLCRRFFIFIFSSFSSSIIDLTLFTLFCFLLKQRFPETYILTSTVLARVISACYNYAMNYTKVFHSKAKVTTSGSKYALLAVLQMSCSALMVNCGKMLLPFMQETVIKIFVDIFLFFISYKIQQKFVYRLRSRKSDLTK